MYNAIKYMKNIQPLYMNHFFKFLILSVISVCFTDCYAQRKDTDAKIPFWNFKKCRERVCIENASVRILYAFNAETIGDKNTWVDEGQLKIGKHIIQYSSHFIEVNEDNLAHWLDAHPKSNVFPPARWLQGLNRDYWIEYQYSQINIVGDTLVEYATMPQHLESENMKYLERLPLQEWNLCDETEEICGYRCQKATCHSRPRLCVLVYPRNSCEYRSLEIRRFAGCDNENCRYLQYLFVGGDRSEERHFSHLRTTWC